MKPRILDCTLRDGSYVNNFSFSIEDTYNITKKLSKAGIDYIEIGHGLGLGASSKTKFKSKYSDFDHMNSVKFLKKANWGVFCIPGIASKEDIKKALSYKPKFIRVGSNLEDYKHQEEFIKIIKRKKILVCSNLMKSYTLSPKKFAKIAVKMKNMGADIIYLVDSAGGMTQDQVKEYFYETKKINNKIKLGFHGHDNIGLANVNALTAYKIGYDIIDCSLQGMGRSAGNTVLEQFIANLIKQKKLTKVNFLKILDISQKEIVQKQKYNKIDSLDLIMGLSLFHSSYVDIIKKISIKYKVDPRKLIISCSQINIKETNEKIATRCAKILSKEKNNTWKYFYKRYLCGEQDIENVKC
tara:strand:- start:1836 stop:2900 length:1065 start_codon:yes stop_codon:yes gene_type:complete